MTYLYAFELFSEFSILPAAVAGLGRLRSILPRDRPFVYDVWAASLSEIVAYILARTIRNNIVCLNIFELIDALLIIQIFHNWGCLRNRKAAFRILQFCFLALWVKFNHSKELLFTDTPMFHLVVSIVHVLMGIDCINSFLVNERLDLRRNGRFIAAMSLVTSSSYQAIQDTITWIQPPFSYSFYDHLYDITAFIMIFVNVAAFYAIKRLPAREPFVLLAA